MDLLYNSIWHWLKRVYMQELENSAAWSICSPISVRSFMATLTGRQSLFWAVWISLDFIADINKMAVYAHAWKAVNNVHGTTIITFKRKFLITTESIIKWRSVYVSFQRWRRIATVTQSVESSLLSFGIIFSYGAAIWAAIWTALRWVFPS